MSDLPRISDAEWAVMATIWDQHPRTAAEVAAALADRAWSVRTVKTLLGRLVKKGVLGFEVDGKRYLYRPRVERDAYVQAESRSFLARHGGAASPLLAHFVREGALSADELAELRRLLDEKEAR
ncbi:MAG: BlaI/MecI/CopY family transcriptional regulator [Planctomycetota bacterium]